MKSSSAPGESSTWITSWDISCRRCHRKFSLCQTSILPATVEACSLSFGLWGKRETARPHLLLKTPGLLDHGGQIPPRPSPGSRDPPAQAAVPGFGTCPWFLSLRVRAFETQHFLVQAWPFLPGTLQEPRPEEPAPPGSCRCRERAM